MKLFRVLFFLLTVFVLLRPAEHLAAQCSGDAGEPIKVYVPTRDQDGNYIFQVRAESGSISGYVGYQGSFDSDSVLYQKATYYIRYSESSQWRDPVPGPILYFMNEVRRGDILYTDDMGLEYLNGIFEDLLDGYTYSFTPVEGFGPPILNGENSLDWEINSDSSIYDIWDNEWADETSPTYFHMYEGETSWQLSNSVSIMSALEEGEDTEPVTEWWRRTAYIDSVTVVGGSDPDPGEFVGVDVSGSSSSFSYTIDSLGCGDWELKAVLERWPMTVDGYDSAVEDSSNEIPYELNEDGGLEITNYEVPVKDGYYTRFKYILATQKCSNGDAAGASQSAQGSAYFQASLGQLNSFKHAGALDFYEEAISQEVYSPGILKYANRDGVTVLKHPQDLSIRQIIAPEAFVDVVRPSSGLASAYDSESIYAATDEVYFDGYIYVSLQDSNQGNNPATDGVNWERNAQAWSDTQASYNLGDQVWHLNVLWEVAVASTSDEPSALSTDWSELYRPSQFEIRFYRRDAHSSAPDPITGLYSILSGKTPFVTYVVSNPSPVAQTASVLKVEEFRGASSAEVITWTQSGDDWSFAPADGLIVEQLIKSAEYDETAALGTIRTERTILKNNLNEISSDVIETYKMFAWGEELISSAADPDGVNRIALYYYHDEDTTSPHYGKLKLQLAPDGNWTYYTYASSGLRKKVISQYGNQPAPSGDALPNAVDETSNQVTEHFWNTAADANWDTTQGKLKLTVQRIQGEEVSRSYRIEHETSQIGTVLRFQVGLKKTSSIRCTAPGAAWDDPSNLITVHTEVDELDMKGRPHLVEFPDGTVTRYTYSHEIFDSHIRGEIPVITTTQEEGVYTDTNDPESFVPRKTVISRVDALGYFVERQVFMNEAEGDVLVEWELTDANDPDTGRPTEISYLDQTTREMQFACCGLDWELNRDGTFTDYTYDAAGRVTDTLRGKINTHNVLDADGRSVSTTVSSGSESFTTSRVYNPAGEMTSSTDALNRITSYSTDTETINGQTYVRRRTSFPHTATEQPVWAQTSLSYQDGRTFRVTGPSVVDTRYEYSVLANGHESTKQILLLADGSDSLEYITTITNFEGRTLYVRKPGATGEVEIEYSYNDEGQVEWVEDATNIKTYYVYDEEGVQWKTYTADDSSGPVQTSVTTYEPASWDSNITVRKTVSLSGDDISEQQVTEITLDRLTSVVTRNGVTSTTISSLPVAASGEGATYVPAVKTVTKTIKDSTGAQISKTVETYHDGRLKQRDELDTSDAVLTRTVNVYDDLGRLRTSTYAGNATTYTYYDDGQIKSVTTADPDPSSSEAGDEPQLTSFVYSSAVDGTRTTVTTLPDARTQTEVYYPSGQLKRRSGARTYTVAYTYDYAGRQDTMSTWQDDSTGAPTLTKWSYNAQGLLDEKYYDYDPMAPAATADLSYTYDDAGRLATRTGGRGLVTTYCIDPTYGYSTGISYSDSTPSVTFSLFDRAGRYTQIEDASGTRTQVYVAGQLDTETYTAPGTALDGIVIDRSYDDASRNDGFELLNLPAAATYAVDYSYNLQTGRFETVSFHDGTRTHTATYGYKPQTHQVNRLVQNNGSTDLLTTKKSYDAIGRLKSIAYNQPYQAHGISYAYNAANQRTYATLGNGDFWLYGYDGLGQVTSARKHLSDKTPIPGFWFTYGFDDIGNRQEADRDQDATRQQSYFSEASLGGTQGANALNQYGSIQTPRAIGVLGTADSAAVITVNGANATRTGEYFQGLIDYSGEASPNAARFETIDIVGTLIGAGAGGVDAIAKATDSFFLPSSPVNITYDLDGNLKTDGRWLYTWNAENRLVQMETLEVAYATGAPRQKLEFAYDGQGRRFSKKMYDWNGASYSPLPTLHFLYLYDGWNLIAEIDALQPTNLTLEASYVWGLDLSGSMQGAGGVGGLLAVTDNANSTSYPFYDGNGNTMGYYNANTGDLAAEFEYGPFGELIRATGAKADEFNFRFSTKYEDAETGLLYYGFRYYDPVTGRWPSRDPIEEEGGLNLYGFVGNDAVHQIDLLGMLSSNYVSPDNWIEPYNQSCEDQDRGCVEQVVYRQCHKVKKSFATLHPGDAPIPRYITTTYYETCFTCEEVNFHSGIPGDRFAGPCVSSTPIVEIEDGYSLIHEVRFNTYREWIFSNNPSMMWSHQYSPAYTLCHIESVENI